MFHPLDIIWAKNAIITTFSILDVDCKPWIRFKKFTLDLMCASMYAEESLMKKLAKRVSHTDAGAFCTRVGIYEDNMGRIISVWCWKYLLVGVVQLAALVVAHCTGAFCSRWELIIHLFNCDILMQGHLSFGFICITSIFSKILCNFRNYFNWGLEAFLFKVSKHYFIEFDIPSFSGSLIYCSSCLWINTSTFSSYHLVTCLGFLFFSLWFSFFVCFLKLSSIIYLMVKVTALWGCMKQLPRAFVLTKLASCSFKNLGLVSRLALLHLGQNKSLGLLL